MPQTVKLAALWLTFWRRLVLGTADGEGRGGERRGEGCVMAVGGWTTPGDGYSLPSLRCFWVRWAEVWDKPVSTPNSHDRFSIFFLSSSPNFLVLQFCKPDKTTLLNVDFSKQELMRSYLGQVAYLS